MVTLLILDAFFKRELRGIEEVVQQTGEEYRLLSPWGAVVFLEKPRTDVALVIADLDHRALKVSDLLEKTTANIILLSAEPLGKIYQKHPDLRTTGGGVFFQSKPPDMETFSTLVKILLNLKRRRLSEQTYSGELA